MSGADPVGLAKGGKEKMGSRSADEGWKRKGRAGKRVIKTDIDANRGRSMALRIWICRSETVGGFFEFLMW